MLCATILDLAKNIGTINYDILLKKFKYYGICGLNWSKS